MNTANTSEHSKAGLLVVPIGAGLVALAHLLEHATGLPGLATVAEHAPLVGHVSEVTGAHLLATQAAGSIHAGAAKVGDLLHRLLSPHSQGGEAYRVIEDAYEKAAATTIKEILNDLAADPSTSPDQARQLRAVIARVDHRWQHLPRTKLRDDALVALLDPTTAHRAPVSIAPGIKPGVSTGWEEAEDGVLQEWRALLAGLARTEQADGAQGVRVLGSGLKDRDLAEIAARRLATEFPVRILPTIANDTENPMAAQRLQIAMLQAVRAEWQDPKVQNNADRLLEEFKKELQQQLAAQTADLRQDQREQTAALCRILGVGPDGETLVEAIRAVVAHATPATPPRLDPLPPAGCWNVPQPNRHFMLRDDILAELCNRLRPQHPTPDALHPVRIALTGMAGVGKSQIALAFANRHAADFQGIYWITADSPEAVVSGYERIASLRSLPESEIQDASELAEAFVHRLEHRESGWLLILDNAEDLESIQPLLPAGNSGCLLYTRRPGPCGAHAEPLPVKALSDDAGALFLLRRAACIGRDDALERATQGDREAAREISRAVGGLLLALDQAGAYIEQQPSTPEKYLKLYRERGGELRKARGRNTTGHDSVTVTFSLAYEAMERADPAAAVLLRLCAFLAPEAIPEAILAAAGAPLAEDDARSEAIRLACGFALLEYDPGAEQLSLHRTVGDVVRDAADETDRRAWVESVVRGVAASYPGSDFKEWPQCEQWLPHLRACAVWIAEYDVRTAEAAVLLHQAGYYLMERAQYAEAEPLMRRALSIDEQSFGPEHPDVARDLNNLAQLLKATNRLQEAEPLMRRVVTIFEKSLGEDHPNVATALNNLASLLQATNRLQEAEPLMRRALSIDEQSFGPEHPNVAIRLNNLASLLQATNRLQEAEPLMRRALSIDEQSFGPDHPDVAIDLNNLAQLLKATNRLQEAEPLMRRALSIDEQSFGPDHPDVARDLNNLAQLLKATNRLQEAEPLMRRVVTIFEKSLGEDHPNVATALNNLASLLQATNRLQEAEPLMRRALSIDEQSFGPEHPNVAIRLNNLAQLLKATNRLQEAEPLMRRALSIDEQSFGPDHPDVAIDLNNLAQLLKATNRLQEAEPLMRRALSIDEQSFGPDHPDVARDLNNLAQLLKATNRLQEAEPLMRRVVTIFEKSLGEDHPNVATALNNLAQLLQATNRLQEAEPFAQRVVEILLRFNRATGHPHPHLQVAIDNYTRLLEAMGRSEGEISATMQSMAPELFGE